MIRRELNMRYPNLSAARGCDTETLHTDVMRFMAILGLCLSAVFALVQSLPVRDSDTADRQSPPHPLRGNLMVEQRRLHALRTELEQLTAQVDKTKARNENAVLELAATRGRLTAALNQAERARRERDRLQSELETLAWQFEQQHQRQDSIRQTSGKRNQKTQAPAIEKDRPPESGSEGPKFTLRFASSATLDRLVAKGEVKLYGMFEGRAWRLSLAGSHPDFIPHASPRRFREMTPATVPASYVQALARTPGTPAKTSVVWGVQLPTETERELAALIQGREGGELVIRPDTRVYLKRK